jgi:hypothetical protein
MEGGSGEGAIIRNTQIFYTKHSLGRREREGRCVPLPTHSAATVLSARIFYADALPPWLRYDSSWS